MIEYTKLFYLLEERNMKKTDLLKVISSGTLAKLGKGGIVQTDTIDKICLFLDVQPNSIMEVYENKEVGGRNVKVVTDFPEAKDINYGNKFRGVTVSELQYLCNDDGTLNMSKLKELINKIDGK